MSRRKKTHMLFSGEQMTNALLSVFLALVLTVFSLPSWTAVQGSVSGDRAKTNALQQARRDFGSRTFQRSRLQRATVLYRDCLAQGVQNLVKPDPNKTSTTVAGYFDGPKDQKGHCYTTDAASVPSPAHAAAADAPSLRYNDLNDYNKGLLNSYINLRYCPDLLKKVMPGFYELCLQFVAGGQK